MPQEIASNDGANQQNANKKKQLKENYEQLEYESQFDRETLDKLRAQQSAKEHAEREEDYGEAKKLKDAIEKLKLVGTQISKLEERKEIAVRNEDYDSAMIIKREIEKLKNAVFAPAMAMNMNQPQQYNDNQNNYRPQNNQRQNNPPHERGGNEDRRQNNRNGAPQQKMDAYNNNMNKSQQGNNEMENDSSIINKSQQNYGYNENAPPYNEDRAIKPMDPKGYANVEDSRDQGQNMNRSNIEEMNKPYDDQPLPNKGGNKQDPYGEMDEQAMPGGQGGNDEPDEAEEIHTDQIGIFLY